MALAGYQSSLKAAGAPVPVVDEATTSLSSTVFQITATARRIMDPRTAITVKANGVTVAPANYTLDRMFGKVTFLAPPAAPVVVTYSFIPVATVLGVNNSSASFTRDLGDVTEYGNTSKKKQALLLDVSGNFSTYDPLQDLDLIAVGRQTLASRWAAGEVFLLEISYGNGAFIIRMWVVTESGEISAAVDGLVESSWNYQTTTPAENVAPVGFGP